MHLYSGRIYNFSCLLLVNQKAKKKIKEGTVINGLCKLTAIIGHFSSSDLNLLNLLCGSYQASLYSISPLYCIP